MMRLAARGSIPAGCARQQHNRSFISNTRRIGISNGRTATNSNQRPRANAPIAAAASITAAASLTASASLTSLCAQSRTLTSSIRAHFGGLRPSRPLYHGRHEHPELEEDEDEEHDHEEEGLHAKPKSLDKQRMQIECTRITMYGLYSNIGLAVFKCGAGVIGNSMAMIADGVHSLSDLVTDGITLWASKLTLKPQDADHPYGHGKFEAIGSLTISVTLAVTAGGIAWSAIESIQAILAAQALAVPTGVALVAAVLSIAVKELLYHSTLRVGNRWNSKVVKANAWHHRSDSISTLVALVGVLGAMVKMPILDPLAGLFVSGLIMKAALELGWDALRDLSDENVDAHIINKASRVLSDMRAEGVLSFHRLRGRAMGPFVLMDVHIHVDPNLSVSAAHQISERVRIRVRQRLPMVSEFLVHVDVAHVDDARRSVFEEMVEPEPKAAANKDMQILTVDHVHEVIREYDASCKLAAQLGHEASCKMAAQHRHEAAQKLHAHAHAHPHEHAHAHGDASAAVHAIAGASTSATAASASAPAAAPASGLAAKFQSIINRTSAPTLSEGGQASSAETKTQSADEADCESNVPEAALHLDLSRLMRPQSQIERDVRRVLDDPTQSWSHHLLGMTHFTTHWLDSRLTIQLELAFQPDLTIAAAGRIAQDIEATVLAKVSDVHKVDVHLELTPEHLRHTVKRKHVTKATAPTSLPSSS